MQQPVTEESYGDGDGQRGQREDRERLVRSGADAGGERHGVESRERNDGSESAQQQPLRLQRVNRVLGTAGLHPDHGARPCQVDREQRKRRGVEELKQSRVANASGYPAAGSRVMRRSNRDREPVPGAGRALVPGGSVREPRAEIEEQRGHQQQAPHIKPVD